MIQWLEDSSLAVAIRQSAWMYPALEIVHIIGIVLLVGPALMFDLRLFGFGRTISIDVLAKFLLSWSRRGLLFIIPSGILLFITNAQTLAYDPVFWMKMGLLLVAGLNALMFHGFKLRIASSINNVASFPPRAKLHATVSILAWVAIIACGRLLAY